MRQNKAIVNRGRLYSTLNESYKSQIIDIESLYVRRSPVLRKHPKTTTTTITTRNSIWFTNFVTDHVIYKQTIPLITPYVPNTLSRIFPV